MSYLKLNNQITLHNVRHYTYTAVQHCVAHTLQLVLRDALLNVAYLRALFEDASSIATEMHQSTKLAITYKAVEDAWCYTAVKSANTTRWNSDLACARTVVTNKKTYLMH